MRSAAQGSGHITLSNPLASSSIGRQASSIEHRTARAFMDHNVNFEAIVAEVRVDNIAMEHGVIYRLSGYSWLSCEDCPSTSWKFRRICCTKYLVNFALIVPRMHMGSASVFDDARIYQSMIWLRAPQKPPRHWVGSYLSH